MTGDRWFGFPRAEATIQCGDARHRLRWERGELLAPDHADLEGERALAALGGAPCRCAELIDGWLRHRDDVRLLVLGTRGTGDSIPPPEDMNPPGPAGNRARAVPVPQLVVRGPTAAHRLLTTQTIGQPSAATRPAPPGRPPAAGRPATPAEAEAEVREFELIAELMSLPGPLPRLLVATVAAGWQARLLAPGAAEDEALADVLPQLEAALYGRVLAALAGWLSLAELQLDLEMIAEDEPPELTATSADSKLQARLPFGWLPDLWGRGLEKLWGRFCLSATTIDGREWKLETVGPEFDGAGVIRIELPG